MTDQIWAKYEQLDSGKFGAVGSPAFNAEACNVDSNTKFSNYMKIQFKGLIYFELQQTLN